MERFGNPAWVLIHQPVPGQRESRYRPARDRHMQRPREERADVQQEG
ncbi:MAG: hypothetical protein IKK21_09940 [Clostridia bacterium]|nr:hypothetical protein [Clostridia bacterium]